MIIASLYPCPFDPQDQHDSSATILNGDLVYSYEEEKLTTTRNEQTVRFPERSLMMGCKEFDIRPSEIDKWVFPVPWKPVKLENHFLFFSEIIKAYNDNWKNFKEWHHNHVSFVDHHLAHASSAVLCSDFEQCAFVCQDGGGDLGDPRNFTFGEYRNGEFHVIASNRGYKNIASFHDYLTESIGFADFENGKTSGLAAYGKVQSSLLQQFKDILPVQENGISFKRERYGKTEVNLKKVYPSEYNRAKIFYQYPGDTNVCRMSLEYLPHDIAATGEATLQEIFLDLLKQCQKRTSMENIVFSGGLFQNVALNNKILESGLFKRIFIPMAPSDSGLSLGAALYVENQFRKRPRTQPFSPFTGPSFEKEEVRELLNQFQLNYTEEKDIAQKSAHLITEGKVVGWFQGKGEIGPRSLGNRSILADPRNPHAKKRINQLLKKREWFMPYAPSIQEEYIHEWVNHVHISHYMQVAFQIADNKKPLIPAALHIDGSSRLQVVNRHTNSKYWRLIDHFRKITGLPLVLNTSFNRHRIATISTPRQAITHLLEGCMDFLAIDDFLVDFSKNRIVSQFSISEKEENVWLAEDSVRRLTIVFKQGNEQQIANYIKNLSTLLKIELKNNGSLLWVDNEGEFPLDLAIEKLIEKIRG